MEVDSAPLPSDSERCNASDNSSRRTRASSSEKSAGTSAYPSSLRSLAILRSTSTIAVPMAPQLFLLRLPTFLFHLRERHDPADFLCRNHPDLVLPDHAVDEAFGAELGLDDKHARRFLHQEIAAQSGDRRKFHVGGLALAVQMKDRAMRRHIVGRRSPAEWVNIRNELRWPPGMEGQKLLTRHTAIVAGKTIVGHLRRSHE